MPFSWYEPMWLENLGFCAEGDGWKLTEAGATAPDGDIPWNPSGGVLSSNPIGASGMVRFGEAAQQVRGRAGDYQVELKTGKALGHAYGGGSQFFSMWVVGSDKPVAWRPLDDQTAHLAAKAENVRFRVRRVAAVGSLWEQMRRDRRRRADLACTPPRCLRAPSGSTPMK